MIRSRRVWPIALVMLATGFVHGQQDVPAGYVFHADQEVRVRDLSPQVARSTSTTAVLIAVLETIFRDAAVCCGKNSALQDGVEAADPLSLKDVGAKIQGRRPGQDGRPVTITAEYMAPDSISPGQIISPLQSNRALLMLWKSRLYLLYGAGFDEKLYYTGQRDYIIHKLFLLDLRFSDSRREVSFNRESDDWSKVQGLLALSVVASQ